GLFRPTRLQLLDKAGGDPVAEAWTWDIAAGFAIGDGRSRTGLYRLEVAPSYRRRGLGRLLVIECLKHARQQRTDVLSVQTSVENHAALGLYQGLDFQQVDTATLYRLPANLSERSRTP
ncbi:MAG TPA: GNAT family N-acetyltransferase, partial [Isosphaeraceae bacterium]|nr:GNAT family N-acetyltransferase [Isosphaeraceae bacterium]